MPEKPASHEDRSGVSPKDDRAMEPPPSTPSDCDPKTPDTEQPEDKKRIERFPER